MRHIATALPEKNDPTIYGIGNSPEDAISDAESFGAEAPFATYPATESLWMRALAFGGANLKWEVGPTGVAHLCA